MKNNNDKLKQINVLQVLKQYLNKNQLTIKAYPNKNINIKA